MSEPVAQRVQANLASRAVSVSAGIAEEWSRIGLECWRWVGPSLPLIQASNLGRIREWTEDGYEQRALTVAVLGYIQVRVGDRLHYVHRLVLTAWRGIPVEKLDARHFETNDKTNNCLYNLRWGTRKENAADAVRHGTRKASVKVPRICPPVFRSPRLPESQIVAAYAATGNCAEIARSLSLSVKTVWRIRTGEQYAHITGHREQKSA